LIETPIIGYALWIYSQSQDKLLPKSIGGLRLTQRKSCSNAKLAPTLEERLREAEGQVEPHVEHTTIWVGVAVAAGAVLVGTAALYWTLPRQSKVVD
jgi:hypothetical protein